MSSKTLIGAGTIATAIVLIVGGIITCTHTINPGYVGIQYNRNGGLEEDVLGQGWNVVSPFIKVTEYPVSTEAAYYSNRPDQGREQNDTLALGTKDGKVIKDVEWIMNYHMSEEDLPTVFNKFRGKSAEEIAYGYMRQTTSRILNELSSNYTMVELCGEKKQEFNEKAIDELRGFFAKDGIIIEQGGLGEIIPDQQTAAAIQSIADAQYKQKEAEVQKQVAIANAQTLIEKANGEAQAKKIQADAEYYYNTKVAESVTENLIKLKFAEKWNGTPPTTIAGEGSGLMLNLK